MALKKIKTLPSEISGEYWRVLQLNNNFDRQDSVIDVVLYVNDAARIAGATPIHSFQHALGAAFSERIFTGSDKVKNVKLAEAYKELKAQAQAEALKPEAEQNADLAFFADAIDA